MGALKELLALAMLTIIPTDCAIQCYKCTTTKPPLFSNETVRLCSAFDYSDKFIVDCPYSTFCMKKYFTARIPSTINATERDCAHQNYITQNFKDGRWQPQVVMEEPYHEGCTVVDDKGVRSSTTVDCYCKSYLCNGARTNRPVLVAVIVAILSVCVYSRGIE